jgi:hypothetical protein
MTRPTFDETIEDLLSLERSSRDISKTSVDIIVASYLLGVGDQKGLERGLLADTFREKGPQTARADHIYKLVSLS